MTGTLVAPSRANLASREHLAMARQALAEADTLPDISRMVDRAEVVRQMAKRAELGRQSQNDWAAFKLDAERKAGALLAEMKANEQRSRGGQYSPHSEGSTDGAPKPTLVDLGVADTPKRAENRAGRWQAIAAIPEEEFEAFKAEAQENGSEITEAAALRLAKEQRSAQQRQQYAAQGYDEWPAAEREMRERVEAGETVPA